LNLDHLINLIDQMLAATHDAVAFVDGISRDEFLADKKTQQAVVMSLLIIGECATRILDKHAQIAEPAVEIPWRNMRGMRNRIAHGYSEINLGLVWDTVADELPILAVNLQKFRAVRQPS
jgi:uncharacterized protein with HEPN domain